MNKFIENVSTVFIGSRNISRPFVFGYYYNMYFDEKEITATVAISSFLPGVQSTAQSAHIIACIVSYENLDEFDNLKEVNVRGGSSDDFTKLSLNNIHIERCKSITFRFAHSDCAGNGLITVFEYNKEPNSFIRKIAEQFITFLIFNKVSGAVVAIHEYDFTSYSKYKEEKNKIIKAQSSKLKKEFTKGNSIFIHEGTRLNFSEKIKIDTKKLQISTY